MRRLAAALTRAWLMLRYRLFGRRYGRLVLETVDGVPLVIMPQVFNPVLLRSGALMARAVGRLPLHGAARPSVLDLGTGSGIGAVFAARRGASVVAVDINPEAVRCARIVSNCPSTSISTDPGSTPGRSALRTYWSASR